MTSSPEPDVMRPVVDWYRATLIGALAGGVFWGLAAGAIYASKASAPTVIGICLAAAVLIVAGMVMYRRAELPPARALGIGLMVAPLTGVAPVVAAWIPGLLAEAISWKG